MTSGREVAFEAAREPAFPRGESAFSALFDANSDALFVHDTSGRILLVNAQMCAMFECSPVQARTLSVGELSANTPPYTQAEATTHVARALRDGSDIFEWQSRRLLHGEIFWSEVALRSFGLEGEQYVIACVRDITGRKRMEEALRASEERFAAIFHHQSNLLAFTEPAQGRILDVNDTWLRATGMTREHALGKTGHELGLWADERDREMILAGIEKQGRVRDHEALLRLDGRIVPTLISVENVALRGEHFLVWEIRDISQQKLTEAERERLRGQLVQAQKMEAVGRLAGGIAHDFNNLLTVIIGYAELLLRTRRATTPERRRLSRRFSKRRERAAALTQQLLAFSRKQVLQPRVLDLNEVVADGRADAAPR